MLPFFWYMLKVMICSGILFGYYWLFLRNKIFHRYNRFYLLASISLSLLLPLLKIDFWQPAAQQSQAIKVLQVFSAGDEYMNTVLLTTKKSNWSLEQLYPMVYILVSLIFFLVMLRTLFMIRRLLKKYKVQQVEQVSFVNTEDASTPFSFLKYMFWNSGIDIDTTTGRQIFKHEVAHIQEKHTHDKLFVNIVLIFCWCNPFFWLYRKELNMIHEFIADKKAVEDSDTTAFAAMILQAAYPKHRFELTNNFFYSPIKRRLMMLTKNKNPRVNYIGRIMVLPLAVLVFAAFSLKAKNSKENFSIAAKKEQVTENNTIPSTGSFVIPEQNILLKVKDTIPGNVPIDREKALMIINGKVVGKGLKSVDQNNLVAGTVNVKWLKQTEAVAKYGEDAADGACEVTYVTGEIVKIADNIQPTNELAVSQDPILFLGATSGGAIQLDHLKSIKEISMSTGYRLVSTDIYFEGPGFDKNVVQVTLNSNSLSPATTYINRCEDGTVIVFGSVKVADKNGVTKTLIAYNPVFFVWPNNKPLNNPVEKKLESLGLQNEKQKLILEQQKRSELEYTEKQLTELRLEKSNYEVKLKTTLPVEKIALQEKQMVELKHKLNAELQTQEKLNNTVKLKTDLVVEKVALQEKEILLQKNNLVFTQVEVNPQFTGGKEAWLKFLQANIKANIPVDNGAKAGKYTVVLKFIVNTDGTLSNVTCENDPGFGTCAEAIRFIKTTPKWQPAVQNGKKVNAYLKQPITFVVED